MQPEPFAVQPKENEVIWVDMYVPVDTRPGAYMTRFTVTSTQGVAFVGATLHVWNFVLPITPSFKSAYHSSPKNQNAYMQHELLRNRVSPDWADPDDEPTLIERWGMNAVNAWFSTGIYSKNCATTAMRPPPSVARMRRVAAQHDVKRILLFNFTADEIDRCPNQFPMLRKWASHLHAAGIKNLVTVPPIPQLQDDGTGTGQSAVDIWVALPVHWEKWAPEITKVQRKGDAVWSYNVLVQDGYSPKNEINFSPLDYRLNMGFISQSLGLSGFQQWAVDNWTTDPWNDITSNMRVPSDGILVYPGDDAGILGYAPSIRLKWTRDGINDFEYIEILKKLGQGPWALAKAKSIAADWKNWTHDHVQVEKLRIEFGEQIEKTMRRAL